LRDAALRPSRFSALVVAADLLADVVRDPRFKSCSAFRRVAADVRPFFGGANLTPALRAFESPIAIACFVDRAPCLPLRMWSISSRTNSPACVDGALPSRLSFRARSIVRFSGILTSRLLKAISMPSDRENVTR
jgi:hypothetical protein